tara:strand:- start:1004 stop:1504 length:501 start_codon:yes stop_codon:yes gene_type:complete
MINIIIIKKNGDVEEKRVKNIDESTIYKFCNYKNDNDFKLIHNFNVKDNNYKVYGKNKGKANTENKYELPPPVDTELFFGTLCIIKETNGSYKNLMKDDWESTYEYLFGGFEDICEDSENEIRSMDSEVYDDEDYTEEGYLKDGFIVSDDELEEEDYLEYDEEDDE